MMNFLDPCPLDERPNFASIQEMWQNINIRQTPLQSSKVQAIVAAFNHTYDNGGARFTRFTITYHPTLHWFAVRNRWDDLRFFDTFFRAITVRATLPEFTIAHDYSLTTAFKASTLFTLDGELAQALFQGGAYTQFTGTASEAKELGRAFVQALFGDRYDEIVVYHSNVAWAAWFRDIAWDTTWVMIDQRHLTIDVLCITDTD
jgi:hypothetical protein